MHPHAHPGVTLSTAQATWPSSTYAPSQSHLKEATYVSRSATAASRLAMRGGFGWSQILPGALMQARQLLMSWEVMVNRNAAS